MRATTLANLGYFTIFPGFFFYYLGLAAGFPFPDFGYFSIMAGTFAVAIATLHAPTVIKAIDNTPAIGGLFVLLVAWCTFWTFLPKLAPQWFDVPEGAMFQLVSTIVLWLACFEIGLFADPESKRFRRFIKLALIVMLAVTIPMIDMNTLALNPKAIFGDASRIPSYQGFAQAAALTSYALLAGVRHWLNRLFLAAICVGLLFTLAARSELAGFVLAVAVVECIRAIRRPGNLLFLPC